MRKNEDRLLKLDLEAVLKFMSDTIFECYKDKVCRTALSVVPADRVLCQDSSLPDDSIDPLADSQWLTNQFVCDAYAVQM